MDPIGDQKEFIGANNVSYPYIKVTLDNLSYYINLEQHTRWRDMDQGLRGAPRTCDGSEEQDRAGAGRRKRGRIGSVVPLLRNTPTQASRS